MKEEASWGIPDGECSGGNTRWGMLGWEYPVGNARVGITRWGILGWETPGRKPPGCISLVFPLELPFYGSYIPLDARGKTHFFQAEFPLSIFQMWPEAMLPMAATKGGGSIMRITPLSYQWPWACSNASS